MTNVTRLLTAAGVVAVFVGAMALWARTHPGDVVNRNNVLAPPKAEMAAADDEKMKLCKTYSETASMIMQARQGGDDMGAMMQAMGQSKIGRQLIVDAFAKPGFRTPENQKQAVSEFANDAYLACARETNMAQ